MDLVASKIGHRYVVDLLKVIRSMRNGFYYAGKVRMMHSTVIALLFMKGPIQSRIKKMGLLTLEHAVRLSIYAGVYKAMLVTLTRIKGGHSLVFDFIAGISAGLTMCLGGPSSINEQFLFYTLSRTLIGGIRLLQSKGYLPEGNSYKVVSIIGWGLVMAIFTDDRSSLQPSLQYSMQYLYEDSDRVNDWPELVPFPIPKTLQKQIERVFPKLQNIRRRQIEREFRTIYRDREFTPLSG